MIKFFKLFFICMLICFAFSSAQADIYDGLVAWYPFDGDAKDASGNENHGTVNGPSLTEDRNGNADSAYSFDGNADYIKLPYNIIDQLNDVSSSVWFKTNKTNIAILSGASTTQDNNYLIYIGEGIRLYIKGEYTSYINISDGKWHQVTSVRQGNTGNVKLYIDGKLHIDENLATGKLIINQNGLIIGREQDSVGGDFTPSQDFEGVIDDLRIYNRILGQSEIIQLYNQSSNQIDLNNGLVAHYEFENNANDSSGNGYHGTENGEVSYSFGIIGNSAKFDGVNDYIDLKTVIESKNNLSISVWVNYTSSDGWNDILAGTCGSPLLAFRNNEISWGGQCNNPMDSFFAKLDIDNKWHHIVGTYDGKLLQLYWDASVLIYKEATGDFKTDQSVAIGKAINAYKDEYYQGSIDDLRIYNRALTQPEISALYFLGSGQIVNNITEQNTQNSDLIALKDLRNT